MAVSPENASERVDQLILLTERLTGLVAKEAQAFEKAMIENPELYRKYQTEKES